MRAVLALTLGSLFLAPPALAQGTIPGASASSGNIASAAQSALQALGSAAKDKLLVRDLLGAPVTGPGGATVGTVADLVVVPGGKVVAAIVSAKNSATGRVPVPFSAVKVAHTAGKLSLSLPVSLSDLKGMKQIQALAQAVPGAK